MLTQTDNGSGRLVVREAGTGPTHDVLGVTHTYKALAGETGGLVSVWEAAVPPGAGAPRHRHAGEDEAFYVLDGELTVEVEGKPHPVVLGRGGFVHTPRGVAHSYRNTGVGPLRLLVMCVPGGLERMFGAIDVAGRSHGAADEATLVDIAARHGVSIERGG